MTGSRTMLITRSDDGYFGLRRSLSENFGEALSSTLGGPRTPGDRRGSSSGTGILKTEKDLAFGCFRNRMSKCRIDELGTRSKN